jgi:hypothetical protein
VDPLGVGWLNIFRLNIFATVGDVLVIGTDLETEMAGLRDQLERLRSENARLLRLLDLTPAQAHPPGPTQTGIYHQSSALGWVPV